jgi:hypothetical protein
VGSLLGSGVVKEAERYREREKEEGKGRYSISYISIVFVSRKNAISRLP